MSSEKKTFVNERLVYFLFLVLITISIGSCDMFVNWFGTSISDRVDSFNDDLSSGKYSKLYEHFHSDTDERSDMKTSGYDWGPLDYYGTHIIDYNISGDSVNGTIDNGSDTMSFTMGMKKDGLDYYILSITIQRSPEDFVIKALR